MSAPAVVIRIDFEANRPRVIQDFVHEGDRDRMFDWLRAHPALRKLVLDAVELEQEQAA